MLKKLCVIILLIQSYVFAFAETKCYCSNVDFQVRPGYSTPLLCRYNYNADEAKGQKTAVILTIYDRYGNELRAKRETYIPSYDGSSWSDQSIGFNVSEIPSQNGDYCMTLETSFNNDRECCLSVILYEGCYSVNNGRVSKQCSSESRVAMMKTIARKYINNQNQQAKLLFDQFYYCLQNEDYPTITALIKCIKNELNSGYALKTSNLGDELYKAAIQNIDNKNYSNCDFLFSQLIDIDDFRGYAGLGFMWYNGLGWRNKSLSSAQDYYQTAVNYCSITSAKSELEQTVRNIRREIETPRQSSTSSTTGKLDMGKLCTAALAVGAGLGAMVSFFNYLDSGSSSSSKSGNQNTSSKSDGNKNVSSKSDACHELDDVVIYGFKSTNFVGNNSISFGARNKSSYDKAIQVRFWYTNKWEDTQYFKVPAGKMITINTMGRPWHTAEAITLTGVR